MLMDIYLHVEKRNYFFNSSKIKIVSISPKLGRFLHLCKNMSFDKMLKEKYYKKEQLKELCREVQPFLKSHLISYAEPDHERNFIFDFNNINFIWELLIKIDCDLNEIQSMDYKFIQIVNFLMKYSYRTKLCHLALTGENHVTLAYSLERIKESFKFKNKTIFYTILSSESISQFQEEDQTTFYLEKPKIHQYSKDEEPLSDVEKYLLFWRYGGDEPEINLEFDDQLIDKITYFVQILEKDILRYREICKLLKQLHRQQKRFFNCSGGINSLVLDFQSGNLRTCHRSLEVVGNLEDGFFYNKRQKYLHKSVLHRSKCKECWARYLCGGSCQHISNQDCIKFKKIIKFILIIYNNIAEQFPQLFSILDNEIEINRHQCFWSPISEYCILEKRIGSE